MKAEQIIDMQVDLLHRVQTLEFVYGMWMSFLRGRVLGVAAAASIDAVRSAYAYRVSPEMTTLIQFAASQLDASDLWDCDLAPTSSGLARFDSPLPLIEIGGKNAAVPLGALGAAADHDRAGHVRVPVQRP